MKPQTVDEYIKLSPKEYQPLLRNIREIIKNTIPEAEEKLSYGMPYYGYKGRLAYFGLASKHLGLYIPPPIIANFKEELEGYSTSVSAVQFPLNKELPKKLIEKLILARVKINVQNRK